MYNPWTGTGGFGGRCRAEEDKREKKMGQL